METIATLILSMVDLLIKVALLQAPIIYILCVHRSSVEKDEEI